MATPARKSASKAAPPKKRADWDAIERDYRTGKFSLRELQAKHGADHGLISRKARKDGWTQDLSIAIKQATNAKLAATLVSTEVNESHQKVTSVVAASADANARIILSHRTRLASLTEAVETAKAKLLEMGGTVADIREAATFVQAVGNLATATKTLIEQERKAHSLDDEDVPDASKEQHTVKVVFV